LLLNVLSTKSLLYYYEFIKLSKKRHKPFSSYGDTSLQAKPLPKISKSQKGHNYEKTNQELWDLCQSCKVITENKCVKFQSIPFSSYGDPAYTQKLNQEFLSRKRA
jgi:hypothetical protein